MISIEYNPGYENPVRRARRRFLDSAGKIAVAEGKFRKLVLTRDQAAAQAEEEARERGVKFDPGSVKSGVTIYQVQGTGAVIADGTGQK